MSASSRDPPITVAQAFRSPKIHVEVWTTPRATHPCRTLTEVADWPMNP
jgi:hypothetical protein